MAAAASTIAPSAPWPQSREMRAIGLPHSRQSGVNRLANSWVPESPFSIHIARDVSTHSACVRLRSSHGRVQLWLSDLYPLSGLRRQLQSTVFTRVPIHL